MSELSEAINEMRTMRESYDVLATELADSKQTIVDAINQMGGSATADMTWAQLAAQIGSLQVLSGDIVFDESLQLPFDILKFMQYSAAQRPIKKILYTTVTTIPSFASNTYIEYINIPFVPNISLSFERCTNLRVFRAEILKYINIYGAFSNSGIEVLYVPMLNYFPSNQIFQYANYLIDLTIGKEFASSVNISVLGYNPTQAYRTDTSSLCYDTDLEEYGQLFSRNWDKWKWCIINHFAANLQDRTGMTAYTITFGSTVLSHFDAEMIAAFTDKNWTLA